VICFESRKSIESRSSELFRSALTAIISSTVDLYSTEDMDKIGWKFGNAQLAQQSR